MLADNLLKLRVSLPAKELNQNHKEASKITLCNVTMASFCLQSVWKGFFIFQSHCLFSPVKNVLKMVKHLDKDNEVPKTCLPEI